MMETITIVTASLLPGLVYLSLGFVLVKGLKRADEYGSGTVFLIRRDYSLFLFVLSLCFFSGMLELLAGEVRDLSTVTDRILLKLYLVSSLLPCIVMRRHEIQDVPWIQFYVPAVMVAVLVLLFEVMSLTGRVFLAMDIMCYGAVIVNMVIFLYVLRYALRILRGTAEDEGRVLARELLAHVTFLTIFNFLFLLYSFGIHMVADYFVAVIGFASVHAVVAASVLREKPLVSCLLPDAGHNPGLGDIQDAAGALHPEPSYVRIVRREDMTEHGSNDSVGTLSLKERLLGYFECEKPYLSKNLTMEEVAMRLFTNKSYLSKTINVEMNKNFRELVNYFRVKEAINIFASNTDISMSELRDRCGFNNNASFTSAFKLNTGYTPGEWCRDMKNKREKAMEKEI